MIFVKMDVGRSMCEREAMRSLRLKRKSSSNYVLPSKFKVISATSVSVICPECKRKVIIPRQVVIDFSPGGKEYHEGGRSDLVCPMCEGLINVS